MRKSETTDGEQAGGRFQPGQSGNPSGRPKGARNRSTLAALAILEGEAEALTRKAVGLALSGDASALRLCLERLVSPVKDRPIPDGAVNLPSLDSGSMAQAVAAVVDSVASGRLTPLEGEALAGLLESHRKAVDEQEIEQRVAALEERAEAGKKARHD